MFKYHSFNLMSNLKSSQVKSLKTSESSQVITLLISNVKIARNFTHMSDLYVLDVLTIISIQSGKATVDN